MIKQHNSQALLALHCAVLLFALSGLFGKWLDVSPVIIVFGRASFACVVLAFVIHFIQKNALLPQKQYLLPFAASGLLLAIHWLSFFYAIQVSSVALGLITFASFPIFVSLLEPIFFNETFKVKTLAQASMTMLGIYLILPNEIQDTSVLSGLLSGLLSALSFAFLTLFNRKFVSKTPAKALALHQNFWASCFLLPVLFFIPIKLTTQDLGLLAILGIVFTALAHSLFNHSLKKIKAQVASIAVSLEPIYGILAAYFLLNETLTMKMIMGGCIVIAANIWATNNKE